MTRLPFVLMLLGGWTASAFGAAVVGEIRLGRQVNEARCTVMRPGIAFSARDPQVFAVFLARAVAPGDALKIEWVTPGGVVHDVAEYEDLPAAPAFCFTSALPLGGAPASAMPGEWRVRVTVNGSPAGERAFRVDGLPDDGSPRILNLRNEPTADGRLRLEIQGWRVDSETSVNLARLGAGGSWEYVAHLLPDSLDEGMMLVTLPSLAPARYVVVLRAANGRMSAPVPLELFSRTGYYLPGLEGEAWRITQRPFGAFSHWGRSVHAWDLAPVRSRMIVAMRGGIVHAFDRRQAQNTRSRSFGNYITIDHGDGEFSHYAHLKTGSFLVRTGERVAAGQPLAEVGNSGYSFGTHVHVHITRAFPIASMSIPFRFADLPEGRPAVVVSQNRLSGAPPPVVAVGGRPPRWQGAVAFAQWWSQPLRVPRGSRELELRHGPREPTTAFDLHAVSPSGQRFTLPAGQSEQPLRIPAPEPGDWRVWVQAVQGSGAELGFWVDAEVRR